MQRTMENNLRKCIILGEMQCNCVHVILFRITELTSVQMASFTMKSKTDEERKKQNKKTLSFRTSPVCWLVAINPFHILFAQLLMYIYNTIFCVTLVLNYKNTHLYCTSELES